MIARDASFAEQFATQDVDRYLGIIATSGPALFDRDTATGSASEEVMGIKHNNLPIEGVQFHPESILTRCGHDLLQNFINTTRQATAQD